MANVITEAVKVARRFIHVSRICSRHFIRRKPVKVLNVHSEENMNPVIQEAIPASKTRSALSNVAKNKELTTVINKPEENVVPYEKLSPHDGRFIKILTRIKSRKQREKSGIILLEGKRLINDAIKAGMQMNSLYFSREKDLKDINIKNPKEVEVCKVLYRTLKVWSDLTTCPGVMAIFKRPNAEDLHILSESSLPVTILCDNIREPGNLGSVIRNAAAAGCANIFLMKGCVDPWELKVLRTGAGGHFRIPIVNDIEWSQISNYIPSTSTIFVADNSVDAQEVFSSSDFINFADVEEKSSEETEEKNYFTYNEHGQAVTIDESFNSTTDLQKYEIPLPCHLYCAVKYPSKNIVLYIGGETHGVDPKITKLICEYGGKVVKIPMENGMDSMNSAFAMTIILYEIKRQLSQLYVTK